MTRHLAIFLVYQLQRAKPVMFILVVSPASGVLEQINLYLFENKNHLAKTYEYSYLQVGIRVKSD